ncbi:MAG: hypothetical protein JO276_15480 [Sphingomonadaceae bacterium]|nr:hypothetical protein [Sphingomonadaceae bacterium]
MPAHQRAVDEIQAAIRAEGVAARPPLFKPAPPRPAPSSDPLDHRVAEELEAIGRRLELLGGALAADPILLHRYGVQLQSIDLVRQMLGHLAQVVLAGEKDKAVAAITLTELKARLQRRPLLRTDAA